MREKLWDAVESYFGETLVPSDPALDAALAASDAAGLPPISVAPSQGKLLQLLARLQGARNILEIGTLGGYSTIWLARALPPDGRLITLEADPKHAEVAAREHRARRPRRNRRGPPRPRPRLAAEDRRRGPRPLRPDLHRRRQAEQPRLLRLGAQALAPRQPDHRRQRRARRRASPMPAAATPTCTASAAFRNDRRRAARERHGDPDGGQQGLRRLRDRAGGGRSIAEIAGRASCLVKAVAANLDEPRTRRRRAAAISRRVGRGGRSSNAATRKVSHSDSSIWYTSGRRFCTFRRIDERA